MSEPKWTKGPWQRGQEGNFRVYGPDGEADDSGLVAKIAGRRIDGQSSANAHLIASAPELAAFIELIDAAPTECSPDRWASLQQRAALLLAKARGES